MFELIINSVKLLISKDGRETIESLINILNDTEEWERNIVTMEVKISPTMEERTYFLSDLVMKKMESLNYNNIVIKNFQSSYLELVKNAIKYGSNKKDIKIIFEITNTYISTIIYNSKNKKFDFKNCIEKLKKNDYKFDVNSSSGRGLIYVYHTVDKLLSISNIGIKFTLYKNFVELETVIEDESIDNNYLIIIVKSGLNNPSVIRKIKKEIEETHINKIIICLNKKLYKKFKDTEHNNTLNTGRYGSIIDMIKEKKEKYIKVVHSNGTMQYLLSKEYFYIDLEEAIKALKGKN